MDMSNWQTRSSVIISTMIPDYKQFKDQCVFYPRNNKTGFNASLDCRTDFNSRRSLPWNEFSDHFHRIVERTKCSSILRTSDFIMNSRTELFTNDNRRSLQTADGHFISFMDCPDLL